MVQIGDAIRVEIPEVTDLLVPEAGPLVVLREEEDFVVIDKPPGMAMHPGARDEHGTLAHRLAARYPELAAIGNPRRPGIVHRLDRDTSGVVVVARSQRGYDVLTQAFASRQVRKRYLLLAHGVVQPREGRIDAPIGRHPTHRTRMAVTRGGRVAATPYQVIQSTPDASLVVATPRTGRTHQVRVHFAAIGHPLVGDSTYGPASPRAPRVMLHAWTLEFPTPSEERVSMQAPIPADFVGVAEALGLTVPTSPGHV